MKYNTYVLNNGLRIIHHPSVSPVIYCGYFIAVGTRDEKTSEEGLAHFCEHITFKGTEHRRAWHILNCLESVGGDLNAFTNKEDTAFYCAITREHIARAVDLLTDIVFHSTYPQNEIDKEVEVVCDEIESYNDSPSDLIYDEFENILFKGHPLGHNILGTPERVRQYTTADALTFTHRGYLPKNSVFFVSGDVNFNRLVKLLENATSDFPNAQPLNTKADVALPEQEKGIIVEHRSTHQAHVMLGNRAYNAYDNRRLSLYLLNNIIGGPGMNARLNVILRERRGLVYTVESSMINYGETGLWAVYFGCDHKDVKRCLHLVKNELERYVSAPISQYRISAAKKQLKGQIGIACDSRENFTLDFAKSFLHYGRERYIDELLAHIDAITPADIQSSAEKIFNFDDMTTLIFE
jgi:predicted Zn-dependent peptidase